MAGVVGIGWRHPHYAELLQTLPALGFLEVHSENFFGEGGAALAVLTQARSHYPISLHGVGLGLGSAVGIDPQHLAQLSSLVERIEPVRVSDHACFARGPLGAGPGGALVHAADLLPIPFNDEALAVLCRNVQQVQEHLRRPLLVENLSAYLDWSATDLAEPEFMSALVARTGCQLLVDVNNIYVNALNAQLTGDTNDPEQACRQWLDAVPVGAVGEIHVAGHCHVSDAHGDIVIDDHGSRVCDAVWRLHAHAQARFPQAPVLVEWDTDIPPLAVLLEEAARAQVGAAP